MQPRAILSRNEVLTYKSSNLEAPDNSILHDAIVDNDIATAIHVILQDAAASDGQTIINKTSLGNTALLLALKRGLVQVASSLLQHAAVDIHLADTRGLSALHWACMLRQNQLIEALLDKGADPQRVTRPWVAGRCDELTPLNLYQHDVSVDCLGEYVKQALNATKYIEEGAVYARLYPSYQHCFFYSDGRYLLHRSGFSDRPDLFIPGEIAYTDVMFHMDALCLNLGWKHRDTLFVTQEDVTRTSAMFAQNFYKGYQDFCRGRNAIRPDSELLGKMAIIHEVEMHSLDVRPG
jgi:hypothetical protein